MYRVTIPLVQNLMLSSKQKFRFGLARPGKARPKRNLCFEVNRRFRTSGMVTLYTPSTKAFYVHATKSDNIWPGAEHPPVVDPDAPVFGPGGQVVRDQRVQRDRGHRVRRPDQHVLSAVWFGTSNLRPRTRIRHSGVTMSTVIVEYCDTVGNSHKCQNEWFVVSFAQLWKFINSFMSQ